MTYTLSDRIREILAQHPHWGPKTVAKAAGTTSGAVRTTAQREGIRFMTREEAEAYIDELLGVLASFKGGGSGETQ